VSSRNDHWAPLLLTAGDQDHTVPSALAEAGFKKYRQARATMDFVAFPSARAV
jgi:hypothetical protein